MLENLIEFLKNNFFESMLMLATLVALFTGKKINPDNIKQIAKTDKKIKKIENKQLKTVQKMEKRQNMIEKLKTEKDKIENENKN